MKHFVLIRAVHIEVIKSLNKKSHPSNHKIMSIEYGSWFMPHFGSEEARNDIDSITQEISFDTTDSWSVSHAIK